MSGLRRAAPEDPACLLLRLAEADADLLRIHARLLRLELGAETPADADRIRVRAGLIEERFRAIGAALRRAEHHHAGATAHAAMPQEEMDHA